MSAPVLKHARLNFLIKFLEGGEDGPCAGRVWRVIDEGFARTPTDSKVLVLRRKSGF
jgi:hypothetical protein